MIIPDNYYEIYPPDSAIQTEKLSKPEPTSDPLPILEGDRLLDTSSVGDGKDRAILFSGGDDSLALTHFAFENDLADLVVHLDTGTSIPENIDYVRSVCQAHDWPLVIIRSPMPFDVFAFRYGFPGSSCHNMAFQYLKARQLTYFSKHREGDVKFLSGVRKLESDRRMKNVSAEVQYEDASGNGNFTGWWLSPLIDKSDEWVAEYRDKHDLSRNPVSAKIHRSGDCQCLAYGHRDTELTMIQSEYPEFAEWILNVETRVQEYRGRVHLLEENHPDVAAEVDEIRESEEPYPMRLTVLQSHFPEVYDAIVDIDRESAILRGQMEPTSYIGHGGLSSDELREKIARANPAQKTLCDNCEAPADNISSSVRRQQQQAQEALADVSVQTTLATGQ